MGKEKKEGKREGERERGKKMGKEKKRERERGGEKSRRQLDRECFQKKIFFASRDFQVYDKKTINNEVVI